MRYNVSTLKWKVQPFGQWIIVWSGTVAIILKASKIAIFLSIVVPEPVRTEISKSEAKKVSK